MTSDTQTLKTMWRGLLGKVKMFLILVMAATDYKKASCHHSATMMIWFNSMHDAWIHFCTLYASTLILQHYCRTAKKSKQKYNSLVEWGCLYWVLALKNSLAKIKNHKEHSMLIYPSTVCALRPFWSLHADLHVYKAVFYNYCFYYLSGSAPQKQTVLL